MYRVGRKSESNFNLLSCYSSLYRCTEYWSAIASGMHIFGFSLDTCLYAIHKDIITVWNIRDLDEVRGVTHR